MSNEQILNLIDKPDIKEQLKQDAFYGIEIFNEIDQEPKHVVETGSRGSLDWQRIEYYPRTNTFRILKGALDFSGKFEIVKYYWNLRTDRGTYSKGTIDQFNPIIRHAINILGLQGVDLSHPEGYPEITDIVFRVENTKKLKPDEFISGDYYLIHDRLGVRKVICFREVEIERNSEYWDEHLFFCSKNNRLGKSGAMRISGTILYEDITNQKGWIGSFYQSKSGERHFEGNEWYGYELSDQEVDVFARFAPVMYDEIVGTEVSREELCVKVTLQGLQYDRWGKDEIDEADRNYRSEYELVSTANYHTALDILINRFGERLFADEAELMFMQHLHGLHTATQNLSTPYKPHSDVSPYWDDNMRLAREVIFGCHPTPENMRDTGIVSNVKTLFGDADFWSFLRIYHKEVFNQFVSFFLHLPKKYPVRNRYASVLLDPIAVIRDYFPEAYQEISSERSDFRSDSIDAMEVLEIF